MILRPARREDAAAIARFIWMAESEMVEFMTGSADPAEAQAILEGWVTSPTENRYSLSNNLVAELDGRPAGSIIAFPADSQAVLDTLLVKDIRGRGRVIDRLYSEGEPGTYYLSTMGVDPECRGRGVGSALIQAAGERARELGFARLSLLVSKNKDRARALYERLGFRVGGEIDIADARYYRMLRDVSPTP
ncbi:MAG: GNAT family N-acetyltransferase [Planctomycetes bacterium]|nr:GNAT family N-acetyltransferase [Planctomycetota bacterium]MCC8116919.1 GNAT family N-acetyltransferase [Planctomycetota bacterium]MCD7897771.1 GNAT family N-acetyltransferase [Planctomycetaceae bacterium]